MPAFVRQRDAVLPELRPQHLGLGPQRWLGLQRRPTVWPNVAKTSGGMLAHYFLGNSRQASAFNGGWGYTNNTQYVNIAKTAGGMLAHYFLGDSIDHVNVKAGLGLLYRQWGVSSTLGLLQPRQQLRDVRRHEGDAEAAAEHPARHRVRLHQRASRRRTASTGTTRRPARAQQGLATNLVNRQAADGSWADTTGTNAQSGAFATGWDVLILQKGVTSIPPRPPSATAPTPGTPTRPSPSTAPARATPT